MASMASGLAHPHDVLNHPGLARAEKQAILASWVSDMRAVPNAPALRQLECGARVAVEDILQALRSLDAPQDASGPRPKRGWQTPLGRHCRKWAAAKLPKLGAYRHRRDDDDDPPPCPAMAAVPVRLSFVDAYGARAAA